MRPLSFVNSYFVAAPQLGEAGCFVLAIIVPRASSLPCRLVA